jgi:hypothetical protein
MRDEFIQEAEWIADSAKQRQKVNQAKKEKLMHEITDVDNEIRNCDNIFRQAIDYKNLSYPEPCPACFLEKSTKVSMKPATSQSDSDLFECPACGREIECHN